MSGKHKGIDWDTLAESGQLDELGTRPLARKLGVSPKTARRARQARECVSCGASYSLQRPTCRVCGHQRGRPADGTCERPIREDIQPGHRLKRLSTYYNKDGEVSGQWVIATEDKDAREAYIQGLLDSIPAFLEPLRGAIPPEPFIGEREDDTLAAYVWGDPHFGLHTWAEETGDKWDLSTAVDAHLGAMGSLIAGAKPAQTAVLALMGDNTHADNNKARTPRNGHPLDVSARHAETGWALNTTVKETVAMLRRKHERVLLFILGGNHDEATSPYFEMAIHNAFEDEPRVEVNRQRGAMKWMTWGNELLVFHHGHGMKPPEIAAAVAADPRVRPLFGKTKHTHVYLGHVHHKELTKHMVYKGVAGCTVEHVGSLVGRDAHTELHGYNSIRSMKLDYWHREQGYDGTHVCGFTRGMASRFSASAPAP